jgi:Mg-chelatase subunit ChlD
MYHPLTVSGKNLPKTTKHGGPPEILNTTREHISLICDISGSMDCYLDGDTTRIAAMFSAVKTIVQQSSKMHTNFSLVTFGSDAKIYIPPTNMFMKFMSLPAPRTQGSTNIAAGLNLAIEMLPPVRRCILLSDGEPTCSVQDILDVAYRARDRSVKIDTISIGGAEDALMKQIAEITGGVWRRVSTTADLCAVYAQLETRAYLQISHVS